MATRKLTAAVVVGVLSFGVLALSSPATCSAGNTVTIDNEIKSSDVWAEWLDTGIVSENTLNVINGSVVNGDVYSGLSKGTAEVKDNVVSITDSEVNGSTNGGYSIGGNANSNAASFTNVNSDKQIQIFGGYSKNGVANNNAVTIKDSALSHYRPNGSSDMTAYTGGEGTKATGNEITVTNSTVGGSVYGAWARSDIASENTVNVENGSVVKSVIVGGGTKDSNAINNSVNITDSTAEEVVIAGLFEKSVTSKVYDELVANNKLGQANNNVLNITRSTIKQTGTSEISGGTSLLSDYETGRKIGGDVRDNTVNIVDSTVSAEVCGGETWGGQATGNNVKITNSTLENGVYGGWSGGTGGDGVEAEVKDNVVSITDSEVNGSTNGGYSIGGNANSNAASFTNVNSDKQIQIFGGYSKNGVANNNAVTIKDSALSHYRPNGSSDMTAYTGGEGTKATGNEITVTNSTVGGSVYGAWARSDIASENTVNVENGSVVKSVIVGGGTKDSNAINNSVNITDSTAEEVVIAGLFEKSVTSKVYDELVANNKLGQANNNVLNITRSTIKQTGTSEISGGTSLLSDYETGRKIGGDVRDNTVNIVDSTVSAEVCGGETWGGQATGNNVKITNSTLDNDVYGGWSGGIGGDAVDNIMSVTSSQIAGGLYGGFSSGALTDATSGNLLRVYGMGSTARSVNNFSFMSFYVPAEAESGSTMMTITGGEATDLASVQEVKVGVSHGNTKLKTDDVVNLIANKQGVKNFNAKTGKVAESDYVEFDSKIGLNSDSTALIATITSSPNDSDFIRGGKLTEESKSPVETAAVAVNLVNSSGDVVADQSMNSAAVAVEQSGNSNEMAPFATTGASSKRINSGSHVDTKGWGINIGVAKELKNDNGKLLFGPIFEYGRANYDSYLDSGYHASGSSHYYGLGLMAKHTNNDGLYYEGSLRFGKLFSDYEANSSTGGKYDTSTKYLSLHAGVGKLIKLDDKVDLDIYGKYFLTHTFGYDTSMVANGREYAMNFGSSNSNRLKLGSRYNYKISKDTTLYTGIAWQYEFSSDNTCTIDGTSTPSPSMKGHTGYLELGIKNTPNNKFECDFGIIGSTGKTRGVGVNMSLIWKF